LGGLQNVNHASISPNGDLVAIAGTLPAQLQRGANNCVLTVYKMLGGEQVRIGDLFGKREFGASAFSPDGKTIAVSMITQAKHESQEDALINTCDVGDTCESNFKKAKQTVNVACPIKMWHPKRNCLATIDETGNVHLYKEDETNHFVNESWGIGLVDDLKFSTDGEIMAMMESDVTSHYMILDKMEAVVDTPLPTDAKMVAFSNDMRYLAYMLYDNNNRGESILTVNVMEIAPVSRLQLNRPERDGWSCVMKGDNNFTKR